MPPAIAGPAPLARFADRRRIGALAVSPFCLGLVTDARMIPAAFDAGINFFFVSADLHWPLYGPWRDGMRALLCRGVRDQLVVAAASYMVHPQFVAGPFHELLHFLPELEHIDILVAGGCYHADATERLTALAELRTSRHNRGLGAHAVAATFHQRAAALSAVSDEALALAFVRHNARHPRGRRDLFPSLPPHPRAAVYAFKTTFGYDSRLRDHAPLRDYWIPDIADHYRWALSTDGVDGLLLSLNREPELRTLDDALARGRLSSDECDHVEALASLIR